ncbi:MAG: TIGR03960 family B12-binding radical SAM protein [Candidatus Omnitrophica bacterium]|nr:TIGR03960 family B12-binding radical SAM protein [Candidatus Omnitrophota bacterium]
MTKKDFDSSEIKFALCFPDLYEVGMSNLGLRIIYGILNSLPNATCERFFSYDTDMAEICLRGKNEILSLESRRRLFEFDIAGFSLASELNYTNVLNILSMGKIPLRSCERSNSHPLIIGGGPCAVNPEPLVDFFDLFVIGEAEDVIREIVEVYSQHKEEYKNGDCNRKELLWMLAQLPGVYVPSFYNVNYDSDGNVSEFKPVVNGIPSRISKRIVKDLDCAFFPVKWLVPYIQIIHDRASIEIMRGCPGRCRFCQARSAYFPFRERRLENVLQLADQIYSCTGYEEISLAGLSVTDYSHIEELLSLLIGRFKNKGVSISLPSIKVKELVGKVSALIAGVKKTGLTFAPEAGSERLRQALGKDFQEGQFMESLERAYLAGYQHIKLYFMIGLPQETEEDLDGIIELSWRASQLRKKINKFPAQVNISINTMIPKPHTPFQWLGMEDAESIKKKQDYLKEKTRKNRQLRLSFYDYNMAFLEGVFSKGDRRLGDVLYTAFRKGAQFDAWSAHFSWQRWIESFKENGIDPCSYLKEKDRESILPWDFIDIGVNKELLLQEFNKTCCK